MLVELCPDSVPYPDKGIIRYACKHKLNRRCKAGEQWFTMQPDCSPTCPCHVRNLDVACDGNCRFVSYNVLKWTMRYDELLRQ